MGDENITIDNTIPDPDAEGKIPDRPVEGGRDALQADLAKLMTDMEDQK